ncbi:MAG: cation diffusion facilitator family transporter [Eubacteriales bacterium]|nr:cation diffusion facilitator family transporter [Eubacteriales bacterium]
MTKLLISKIKNKYDISSTIGREKVSTMSGWCGIICNAILCLIKFIIGMVTGSVSITADAFNNLSDAGSNVVTIAGAKLANKPVDKEHPFGHGRIEYVSALVVSFIILLMGFELGKNSVMKIIKPEKVDFSIVSLVVLILAICVKLWMAYFNNKLFKLTNNINLKAVSQDSLNDCIATGATILSLVISYLTGFYHIDGIVGLLVAGAIILSGIGILKDTLGPLLGQPPSPELVKRIEDIITDEAEIVGVHDLIVHDYGPGRIIASAHAEVPSNEDIVHIHDVIDNVEKKIQKELNIIICIHLDPIDINNEEVNKYKAIAQKIIKQYNDEYSFHDFRMVNGETHKNLIFDLVIPFDKNNDTTKILNDIVAAFKKYDESLNVVVTLEHSFI